MSDRSTLQLTEGLSRLATGLRRIHEGERIPNELSVLLFQVWPRISGLLSPEERKPLKAALGRLSYGDYDPGSETHRADALTTQRDAGTAATECERLLQQLGNADGENPVKWRAIRTRLQRMASSGERYTSHAELAERLGCGKTTVGKAIRNSPTLLTWQSGAAAPRATGLNEVVTDNEKQETEPDPSELMPAGEEDAIIGRLIDQAEPAEQAELLALNAEGRRNMAVVFRAQEKDPEPSSAEDDPPGKPRRVKQPRHV